jgi:hypothetical protein
MAHYLDDHECQADYQVNTAKRAHRAVVHDEAGCAHHDVAQ